MNQNKFYILLSVVCCAFLAMNLQAQESLLPIQYNSSYEKAKVAVSSTHTPNARQKSGGDDPLSSGIQVAVNVPTLPACEDGDTSGIIELSISNGVLPYTVGFSGPDINKTQIAIQDIQFNDLKAGVYFINITDKDGLTISETIVLNPRNEAAIDPNNFIIDGAGCDGVGSISVSGTFTTQLDDYVIYDQNHVATDTLQPSKLIDLDKGFYYVERVSKALSGCSTFYDFEIPEKFRIRLPMVDDFSTTEIYPEISLWEDNFAFVNETYPINPPTIGVATLDGLNQFGRPYSNTPFKQDSADVLTSRPFCMNDYAITDSIFISFYFENKGYGDFSNEADTLFIQFKDNEGIWNTIDFFTKEDVDRDGLTDKFKRVFYTVNDEKYFNYDDPDNAFQFRFRNRATVSGNNDHWHLDYIKADDSNIATDRTFFKYTTTKEYIVDGIDTIYQGAQTDFQTGTAEGLDTLAITNWDTVVPAIQVDIDDTKIDSVFTFDFEAIYNIHDVEGASEISEIAFVEPVSSILKNYEAMPWKHFITFQEEELNPNYEYNFRTINFTEGGSTKLGFSSFNISNNCALLEEESSTYNLNDNNSLYEITSTGGTLDSTLIRQSIPFIEKDFVNIQSIYQINDSKEIPSDDILSNNTLVHNQIFDDYFAYDDGSAEAAYGLYGGNSKLAHKFNLNKSDVLQAIDIHFTNIAEDVADMNFALVVWKSINEGNRLDANNDPAVIEDTLYYQPLVGVEYVKSVNGFYTYPILPEFILSGQNSLQVSDSLYVGIVKRDAELIPIGFDRNNVANDKIFLSVAANKWENSIYSGALMIRPVFSAQWPVGIEEVNLPLDQTLAIYPNPAHDFLYFEIGQPVRGNVQTQIYDLFGRLVYNQTSNSRTVPIQDLPAGMYMIKLLNDQGGNIGTSKFLKK